VQPGLGSASKSAKQQLFVNACQACLPSSGQACRACFPKNVVSAAGCHQVVACLQVVKEVTDDALRPAIPEDLPTPSFPGQDEYIELMQDCWQQVRL
jgi:hypothetical protein